MNAKYNAKLRRLTDKFLALPGVADYAKRYPHKPILVGYHYGASHLAQHIEPSTEYSIRFALRTAPNKEMYI